MDVLNTKVNVSAKRDRGSESGEGDDDDELLVPQGDLSQMSRSERKRHREKKRRSDVNKGFEDLTTLLWEIDPSIRAEADDRAQKGQSKGHYSGVVEDATLSRVDLISRTVQLLRRLHVENERNKAIIGAISRSGVLGPNFDVTHSNLGRSNEPNGNDVSISSPVERQRFTSPSLPRNCNLLPSSAAASEANQIYNQNVLLNQLLGVASNANTLEHNQAQDILNFYTRQSLLSSGNRSDHIANDNSNVSGSNSGVHSSIASLYGNIPANLLQSLQSQPQQQQLLLNQERNLLNLQNNQNSLAAVAALINNDNNNHIFSGLGSTSATRKLLEMLQERQQQQQQR